ncbi:hypothetical protein P3S72_19390 [Pseudomonas sp. D3]|nr:hypothetical protein [Pseudomonas sp. D3]WET08660.1 hypothetical protein P3S72_19390 [Pseudomonas sp. D3]
MSAFASHFAPLRQYHRYRRWLLYAGRHFTDSQGRDLKRLFTHPRNPGNFVQHYDCLIYTLIRCGQALLQFLHPALRGNTALGRIQKHTGSFIKGGGHHNVRSMRVVANRSAGR